MSVCIVNWNAGEDLSRCLDLLLAEAARLETEVIVVDNGSTDESPRLVQEQYPQVQLVRNRRNRGFAAANNQGLVRSRGKYFMLLNPDAFVQHGALTALVEFMDRHPRAAAAGPKLLNPDGSLQYSCRSFPTLGAGFFRNTVLGRLFPRNRYAAGYVLSDWDHRTERQVDWVSGACMIVRRKAAEAVGYLDEGYFMYCEDVDWCYRFRQNGWEVHYIPEAVVIHRVGRSSDQVVYRMLVEHHKSMWRFYVKHYSRGLMAFLLPLVLFGIAARCAGVLCRPFVSRHWPSLVSGLAGRA